MEGMEGQQAVEPCRLCQLVDYVPFLSVVTGSGKAVVGIAGAAIFGTVAGVARVRAQYFYVTGDQNRGDECKSLAGRACHVATGGVKLAGRGLVSTLPVVGNGICLGMDCYEAMRDRNAHDPA
jgi:hypothetical protein